MLLTEVDTPAALLVGTALIGLIATSLFALVPAYLARRFPAQHRSFGMGTGYAIAGLGLSAVAVLIPWLALRMGLASAMAVCIVAGSLGAASVAAMRPRDLSPHDAASP